MSADPLAAALAVLDGDDDPFESPPTSAYEDEPRAHVNGRRQSPAPIASLRKLTGINFADMRPHLTDSYCVKGLFSKNSTVGIVGPPGCGKTFFGSTLAVHIASGSAWRGLMVRPGLVVYAALEGAVSAENRFYAARSGCGVDPGIPLKLTPGPVNLRSVSDVEMLIDFIRGGAQEHGVEAAAIFVDTLSRAMCGGDENTSEDMGALIAGVDRVRLATGATVFLIHHTGKDESRGARGHSALFAAFDTEVQVSKAGNVHVATVTKQRDLPSGARYAFTLEIVELGRDADGEPVTTCVMRAADQPEPARKPPLGKRQEALCAALVEWQRSHDGNDLISSIEFRDLAKTQGIQPKHLPKIAEALAKCGWLGNMDCGYQILPEHSP